MKKSFLLLLVLYVFAMASQAQRKMETLDRGVVAVKVPGAVFVSWRIMGYEWYDVAYNVYRDGELLNDEPLQVSNFRDVGGTLDNKYTVSAIVKGEVQEASAAVSPWKQQYTEIKLKPRNTQYYEINDGTVADLDGDGEYEIIIKRLNRGYYFGNDSTTFFEAYKQDGTFLWEINAGPNIYSSGGVEINIAAFDFDEDGKAEVFMRTSDGTVFGDGTNIGDRDKDGTIDYRPIESAPGNMEYPTRGPEYLSLIDGETGIELDWVNYIPRGNASDWGDNYGHRCNKFFFGAPYLDGKKPSLFTSRGIYTKIVMRAYDVVDKKIVTRWEFKSENNPGYSYQGNHNYTIADVDMDGRDEIVYGGMTVDDDGTGLYSTELGHGDALHVGDFDPFRKGTEIWRCLENSPFYGTSYYDGATGEILIHDILGRDCGRCMAANVTDDVVGASMWGSNYRYSATTKEPVPLSNLSSNFRIFWDGDLLDELLTNKNNTGDGVAIIHKANGGTLLEATGTITCNWTKGTPVFQADLFGDWREEVIWRTTDNKKVRIYTTVDLTPYRNYSLMYDHQYRQAICWQMCGYNQPPHVSYFLGEREGFTVPPPPTISNSRLVYTGTGDWDTTTSNWTKDDEPTAYSDGEHVLFDVSSGENVSLALTATVSPSVLTVNSPGNYTLDASAGKLTGDMKMVKQGLGTFHLNGTHDFSGKTEIWTGCLDLEGTLTNSPVWLNTFTELDAVGLLQKGVSMRYGSELYVGGKETFANLEIFDSLYMQEKATLVFDVSSATGLTNDTLKIEGNLSFAESGVIRIQAHLGEGEERLAEGSYVLATVSGKMNFNLDDIAIEGILGTPAVLEIQDNNLVMIIKGMREAASIVWSGSVSNEWDLVKSTNFINNGSADVFVTGDAVEINNEAVEKTIAITEEVSPASVVVNSSETVRFTGEGSISGTASLTKSGEGALAISNTNTFTGKVTINEGSINVSSLPNDLNEDSPLGPVSSDANLFELNGGQLAVSGETSMDRAIKVGSKGGTITNGSTLKWNAPISGGELTKTGSGEVVFASANTLSKLMIQGGSVRLLNEAAVPAQVVVLENASLASYNSQGSYSSSNFSIEVPEGKTGSFYLDDRCSHNNKLTGGGTLNLYTNFIRAELNGNWSGFTGTINVNEYGSSSYSQDLRINNSFGYENAIININQPVVAYHTSGSTVKIGALTGRGEMGNAIWEIGGRNEDFIFQGTFSGGSLRKVGTGTMSMFGYSTSTQTSYINEGTFLAINITGSATGTGSVYVRDGAFLGGYGTISGDVIVQTGGTLYAGTTTRTGASLRVGSARMFSNSTFHVKANGGSNYCDKLTSTGSFTADGALVMENTGSDYEVGNSYLIVSASAITGSFESISPAVPGDGLEWDLTDFPTTGKISVVLGTSTDDLFAEGSLNVYPNPSAGRIYIELPNDMGNATIDLMDAKGMILSSFQSNNQSQIELNLSDYSRGVYLIRAVWGSKTIIDRIIIR